MLNLITAALFCTLLFVMMFFGLRTIIKQLLIVKELKKFLAEIQKEITAELTFEYSLLVRGEIDTIDFLEKQEWVGQLYSKIFEDYKKDTLQKYSLIKKGRTKVK
jgi:hypothetical protein